MYKIGSIVKNTKAITLFFVAPDGRQTVLDDYSDFVAGTLFVLVSADQMENNGIFYKHGLLFDNRIYYSINQLYRFMNKFELVEE